MTDTISIPGYTIERELGRGGMATVYLAIQQSLERRVALKVMSPQLGTDPTFTTRFMREARIVSLLNHSSIVPVFAYGEHDSRYYLAMEYLPAGDLKHRISDRGHDASLAVQVCLAISAALDVAHRKGFVHRDIKPENILFREDGTPVLTDFGIARALDSGALTQAGKAIGTPRYMSPEQAKGLELDGRSDLYSLGIVFFESLTGRAPFESDSSLTLALQHVSEPLPRLPLEHAIYQELLDRLTAKDREDRFPTGAEVARALRRIRSGKEPTIALPTPRAAVSRMALASRAQTLIRPRMPVLPVAEADEAEEDEAAGAVAATAPGAFAASVAAQLRVIWREADHFARTQVQPLLPAVAAVASAVMGLLLIVGTLSRHHVSRPHTQPVTVSRPAEQDTVPAAGQSPPDGSVRQLKPISDTTVPPPAPAATEQASASSVPASSVPASSVPAFSAHASSIIATRLADLASAAPHAPRASSSSAAHARETRAHARETRRRHQHRESSSVHLALAVRRDLAETVAQVASQQAQELRIEQMLAAARQAYDEGHLWQPSGSSAADQYRAILNIQPSRPEALAGAHRLAAVLAQEADNAAGVGDVATARQLVAQVKSLQPDQPLLPELRSRLEQLQVTSYTPSGRELRRLQKAESALARAREDLEQIPLDRKAVDAATHEYERALSASPQAPGLPSMKERLIAAYVEAVHTELSGNAVRNSLRLIDRAHRYGFSSAELDQIEAQLKTPPTEQEAIRAGRH